MTSFTLRSAAIAALSLLTAAACHAGAVTSQAQLSTILGAGETMENFEGNGLLPTTGQIAGSGPISSTSSYAGYGPGLVQAGATYNASTFFWNADGYYGLHSRTLGDSSGWRGLGISISYTAPVTAFGFDLAGYAGYSDEGVVEVFDTSNNLLTSASVRSGFFGWENAAGIGRITVSANSGYLMIDNHGYGSASATVPEPGTLALLAVAGLGAAAARRKRTTRA
jgi:hypothetical protein